MQATLDPIILLAEVRAAQLELGHRVDRRAASSPASSATRAVEPTSKFASELGKGMERGGQRTIHRRPYHRRKPVPQRPSMLDAYAPTINGWLAVEPHISAIVILARLSNLAPAMFARQQRRTVQRVLRDWRGRAARTLLDNAAAQLAPPHPQPLTPSVGTGHLPVTVGNIAS
jgi:hypothetical protein